MPAVTDGSVIVQQRGDGGTLNAMSKDLRPSRRQQLEQLAHGFSPREDGNGRSTEVVANPMIINGTYTNSKRVNSTYVNGSFPGEVQSHKDHKDGIRLNATYTNGIHTRDVPLENGYRNSVRANSIKANDNASNIIDIRSDRSQLCLAEMVRTSLRAASPSLPSLALWDDRGLQLFEEITRLADYYLYRVEREIFEQRCGDIARDIESGSMIVDLGCGSADKIMPLLCALNSMGRSIDYYALDLSSAEVSRSLAAMSVSPFKYIRRHGLVGTFDDARSWLQSGENLNRPKCLVSLGSSIGNLTDGEAAEFLGDFVKTLRHSQASTMDPRSASAAPRSTMLVGLDSCMSEDRVRAAYDDPDGLNGKFLLNALNHINRVLEYEAFRPEEWRVHREWSNGCHKQYLVPLTDIRFEGTHLGAGTKVHMVQSQKFSAANRARLWEKAGLREMKVLRRRGAKQGNENMISMLALR